MTTYTYEILSPTEIVTVELDADLDTAIAALTHLREGQKMTIIATRVYNPPPIPM